MSDKASAGSSLGREVIFGIAVNPSLEAPVGIHASDGPENASPSKSLPRFDAVPVVRRLGLVDYEQTWRQMQDFTAARTPQTPDEIWLLEHPPVFTQGLNGRREHLLAPGAIPVIQVDRGGQVTYHGPGQLVVYPLLELNRHSLSVRSLVELLENAVIALCAEHGIEARGRRDAPGVYVGGRKLASIGLRIKRGCSYHGLALNVTNDLEPFSRINPCGYAGLEVVKLADLVPDMDVAAAGEFIAQYLRRIGR